MLQARSRSLFTAFVLLAGLAAPAAAKPSADNPHGLSLAQQARIWNRVGQRPEAYAAAIGVTPQVQGQVRLYQSARKRSLTTGNLLSGFVNRRAR